MEAISKLFTTEDQAEMKQSFKEIIIKQFENDVEQNTYYLFDPNDIEEEIREAFTEVIDEIKLEFKEKLKEQMMKLLESNDIEKLLTLKKKVK
jgi:hypothetical protein